MATRDRRSSSRMSTHALGPRACPLPAIGAALLLAACTTEEAEEELSFIEPDFVPEGAADVWSSRTVGELVDARTCSTAPSMPLNAQIAAQLNCSQDDLFSAIDDIPNVRLGAAANPFMQGPAARALRNAAAANPGATMVLHSTWRSVVQQYILSSWQGSCGIGVAAPPGRSNHESGLAIDLPLETTQRFRSALRNAGFAWYCDINNRGRIGGCRDTPHHSYRNGREVASLGVRAFQQLWNRAHPEDRIRESGAFDSSTRSRMRRAPLGGFPTGSSCGGGSSGGEAPTCSAGERSGECLSTDECDAETHLAVSGLCPHLPADVQCCIPVPRCEVDGIDGLCVRVESCDPETHQSTPGYCPDLPSEIRCCTPRQGEQAAPDEPPECTDSCEGARNGRCDDGREGAESSDCQPGTDCTDCEAGAPAALCSDSCRYASDGECDDGGEGSSTQACDYGTDCTDCGER